MKLFLKSQQCFHSSRRLHRFKVLVIGKWIVYKWLWWKTKMENGKILSKFPHENSVIYFNLIELNLSCWLKWSRPRCLFILLQRQRHNVHPHMPFPSPSQSQAPQTHFPNQSPTQFHFIISQCTENIILISLIHGRQQIFPSTKSFSFQFLLIKIPAHRTTWFPSHSNSNKKRKNVISTNEWRMLSTWCPTERLVGGIWGMVMALAGLRDVLFLECSMSSRP